MQGTHAQGGCGAEGIRKEGSKFKVQCSRLKERE